MQKTIFVGQVNDKQFDSRAEMYKYIQYCIENDIDITYTSSHSETRWFEDDCDEVATSYEIDDCDRVDECNCNKTTGKVALKVPVETWPSDYPTVEDYIVPYLYESALCTNSNANKAQIEDVIEKLQKRLQYFENNFNEDFKHCINYNEVVTKIYNKLIEKEEYCKQRIDEIRDTNKNMTQRKSILQAEIANLESQIDKNNDLIEAYDNLEGYSSALIKYIEDNKLL